MHVYAFGSLCRGEVSPDSDVDLLAIVHGTDTRFNPDVFSIYSYERIQQLWLQGNPFAWHLSKESRLIFSQDDSDFIASLGSPAEYVDCIRDCEKFYLLFRDARESFGVNTTTATFDLSVIFLSIRNIATCFSLGVSSTPDFSRDSALRLGAESLEIDEEAYAILRRARILCTRGYGPGLSEADQMVAAASFQTIEFWMRNLVYQAKGV